MVCCCIPCFKSLQKKFDPVPGSGPFTLCVTEVIRWLVIIGPLYLAVWRYAELTDCYSFDLSECPQNRTDDGAWVGGEPEFGVYWGYVSAIILGSSLIVYLPIKMVALRWRMKNNKLKDHRWRPSIFTYIMVCALPSLVIIGVAAVDERNEDINSTLDSITTTVLQVMVLGLTFTEWMSKLREEHLTFDLITAMSQDFFFAYDVIQFLMMCTYEKNIFHSDWFFVCFTFAFIAMFKYIPTQPTNMSQLGAPKGAAVTIIISMLCVDIPFVIVRLWTMIEFGLIVSDLIHPIKNIALIFFGSTQLWIIYTNYKAQMKAEAKQQAEKERKRMVVAESRKSRFPVCVWSKEHGAMICTWETSESPLPRVSRDVDIEEGIDEENYWKKQQAKDGKSNQGYQDTPAPDYEEGDNKAHKRKSKGKSDDVKMTDVEDVDDE